MEDLKELEKEVEELRHQQKNIEEQSNKLAKKLQEVENRWYQARLHLTVGKYYSIGDNNGRWYFKFTKNCKFNGAENIITIYDAVGWVMTRSYYRCEYASELILELNSFNKVTPLIEEVSFDTYQSVIDIMKKHFEDCAKES